MKRAIMAGPWPYLSVIATLAACSRMTSIPVTTPPGAAAASIVHDATACPDAGAYQRSGGDLSAAAYYEFTKKDGGVTQATIVEGSGPESATTTTFDLTGEFVDVAGGKAKGSCARGLVVVVRQDADGKEVVRMRLRFSGQGDSAAMTETRLSAIAGAGSAPAEASFTKMAAPAAAPAAPVAGPAAPPAEPEAPPVGDAVPDLEP